MPVIEFTSTESPIISSDKSSEPGDTGSSATTPPTEGDNGFVMPAAVLPSAAGTQKKSGTNFSMTRAMEAIKARPLNVACPSCHQENTVPPKDKEYQYCAHCGNTLGIHQNELTLKQSDNVAIGFIKIKGVPTTEAEEQAAVLERIRKTTSQVVEKFNGFVKFMGDKALLVFGLHTNTEAPATAQSMLKALAQLNHEFGIENLLYGTDLSFVAGLHLGTVLSGTLGVTGQKWTDVLGSDVNFAARVFSANEGLHPLTMSQAFTTVIQDEHFDLGEATQKDLKGFGMAPVYSGSLGQLDPNRDIELTMEIHSCQHQGATRFCPYCGNNHFQNASPQEQLPQNRDVFILSIDMAGFTKTSSGMKPQDVAKWVNEFYINCEPVIAKHGGVIIGRNADEILVRFGVPSQGNTALHSLMCAFELKQKLSQQQHSPITKPIHFRIGLSHGTSFVQGITTVGPTIEGAQQVQSRAPIDGIVITEDILQSSKPYFDTADLNGDFVITGINEKMIQMAEEKRTMLPVIGRGQQLATLNGLFQSLTADNQKVAFLTGQEGSGRKGVVWQFVSSLTEPVTHLMGDVTQFLQDPLKNALRNHFDEFHTETSNWANLMTAINLVPAPHQDTLPPGFDDGHIYLATLIGRYMGYDLESYAPVGLKYLRENQANLRRETEKAIAHYLRELSNKNSLVLTLNRLDRTDEEARSTISNILNQLKDSPVLVLALVDSNWDTKTFAATQSEEIKFPSLDLNQTGKLAEYVIVDLTLEHEVRQVLLPPVLAASLIDHIYKTTGGHPLHVVELIKLYLQNNWIKKSDGIWNLQDGVTSHGSLEDLLTARLDQLETTNPEARRLLSLSVIAGFGRESVSKDLLVAAYNGNMVTFEGRKNFEHSLKGLIKGGYLTPKSAYLSTDEDEYVITPVAYQDVILRTMTPSDKKTVHRKVFEFLKSRKIDTNDILENLILAATHAQEASLSTEAINHYHAAIQKSDSLGLNAQTLNLIERASQYVAAHNMGGYNVMVPLFQWYHLAFEIHLKKSNPVLATQYIEKMSHVADKINNPDFSLQVLSYKVFYQQYFKNSVISYADLETQASRFTERAKPEVKAEWFNRIGYAYVITGQFEKAKTSFESAKHFALEADNAYELASSEQGMAQYYGQIDDPTNSIDAANRAMTYFQQNGFLRKVSELHSIKAAAYLNLSLYDDCIREGNLSIETARKIEFITPLIYANLNILTAFIRQSKFTEAAVKATEALQYARDSKQGVAILISQAFKAVCVVLQNPGEALELATEAVASNIKFPAFNAIAHFAQGLAHAHLQDVAEASKHTIEALKMRDGLETKKLDEFDLELNLLATHLATNGAEIPSDLYATSTLTSPLIPGVGLTPGIATLGMPMLR